MNSESLFFRGPLFEPLGIQSKRRNFCSEYLMLRKSSTLAQPVTMRSMVTSGHFKVTWDTLKHLTHNKGARHELG